VRLSPTAFGALLTAFAAVVVGGIAVWVQVDRQHAFNRVRVTLENGHCFSGSYLTRNDNELLIAAWIPPRQGPEHKPSKGQKPAIVSIRRDETAELQVEGPRRAVVDVIADTCTHPLTKPTAGESPKDGSGSGGSGSGGSGSGSGPAKPRPNGRD
jgi:hypothetical protein